MASTLSIATLFLASCCLTLTVVEGNRNRPKITLQTSSSGNVIVLPENSIKKFIGLLEVSDEDTGPSGEVTCAIVNDYVALQKLTDQAYKVVQVEPLDRETQSSLEVKVTCQDRGTPSLSSSLKFEIVVKDKNDNAPIFPRSVYKFSVAENSPLDTVVSPKLQAMDYDNGENQLLTYALDFGGNESAALFGIDPQSGRLYTTATLDRENQDLLNFVVTATDFGEPPQTGSAEVQVEVTDRNDNYPTILTKELAINENMPALSVVGVIQAEDMDYGANNQIVFTMLANPGSGVSRPPFMVKRDGTVLAVAPLDRERLDTYSIHVAASDKGTPSLTSSAMVSIQVLDDNDHSPVLINVQELDDEDGGLSWNESQEIVVEDYKLGQNNAIFSVVATDKDTGDNGRVSFFLLLVNGEDYKAANHMLAIGEDSGKIYFRRHVRSSDDASNLVVVQVRDNGIPAREVQTSLNVTLDFDFSNLPTTSDPTTYVIEESIDNNNNGCGGLSPLRHVFALFATSLLPFSILKLFS